MTAPSGSQNERQKKTTFLLTKNIAVRVHQKTLKTYMCFSGGRSKRPQNAQTKISTPMIKRNTAFFLSAQPLGPKGSKCSGDWRHCYVGLEGPVVPNLRRRYDWIPKELSFTAAVLRLLCTKLCPSQRLSSLRAPLQTHQRPGPPVVRVRPTGVLLQ